MAKRNKTDKNL